MLGAVFPPFSLPGAVVAVLVVVAVAVIAVVLAEVVLVLVGAVLLMVAVVVAAMVLEVVVLVLAVFVLVVGFDDKEVVCVQVLLFFQAAPSSRTTPLYMSSSLISFSNK